uniref:Uncharacterized protein n=1 Tax=Nelumbo nucifera TaxID=4432 RepID=A0A822Y439_NELNU|nr:TPA_asm: hypothetical protein HUJ06_030162 [Nelumbo nucifera]
MASNKHSSSTLEGNYQKETVSFRLVSRDEEGKKRVEKAEVNTSNPETLKYIEKKLRDKGVQRMDRRPVDGNALHHTPPKSGHGGKFTWEGSGDIADTELSPVPPAIDEGDPNYVDEEVEERILKGEEPDVDGLPALLA